jgi:hypothetical protein
LKKQLNVTALYTLVFFSVYVLVTFLTVAAVRLFGNVPPIVSQNATTGFPNAAPQMRPPVLGMAGSGGANDGEEAQACVTFCTSESTGEMVPCANKRLLTCSTDDDCDAGCTGSEDKYKKVTCQQPSDTNWPTVRTDQMRLNNGFDKYCLPTALACLANMSEETDTDVKPVPELVACRTNSDCARCTDELPNKEQMVCEIVQQGTKLTVCDASNDCVSLTTTEDGQYCLPRQTGCNYLYGDAKWTAENGWVCSCKYPALFEGEHCDELVACQARDVTAWSASKQQLLLNMESHNEDGSVSAAGTPWKPGDVNPGYCVDKTKAPTDVGYQYECDQREGEQTTVACQCDGVQNGTLATYMVDTNRPLQCVMDPCYENVNGGRTLPAVKSTGQARVTGNDDNAVDEFPEVPNQPATTCACSGFGSKLWQYNSTIGEFEWIGHCEDTRIPGSDIVLPRETNSLATALCAKKINTVAGESLLVPGKNDSGGDKCAPDPCAGRYSDSLYMTEQAIGNFDYRTGACACKFVPDASCTADNCTDTKSIKIPDSECDHVVNPVCSYCADACSQPLDESCPTAPGQTCANKRCRTNADGSRTCECGASCFWYNNACHQKIQRSCECALYNGVEGACVTPGDTCHPVKGYQWVLNFNRSGCLTDDDHKKVVCFPADRGSCGQATCFSKTCGGPHPAQFLSGASCGVHA